MTIVDRRNLFCRRGIYYFKPKAGAAQGPWVHAWFVPVLMVQQSKRWKKFVFLLPKQHLKCMCSARGTGPL